MSTSSSLSKMRERLLGKINYRHDVPLEILIYPGSRILSIHRPDDNNILNQHVLERIADRVSIYDTNHTISAIFFTSYTPYHFSSGLDLPSMISSEQRVQALRAANILTKTVQDSTKSTIGVFGGDIDRLVNNDDDIDVDDIDDDRYDERYNDTSNVANDDDYDDGDFDSIAFAVFGFSKFRLGTQQTRFQIADLLIHGRLPLGSIMISICMHTL